MGEGSELAKFAFRAEPQRADRRPAIAGNPPSSALVAGLDGDAVGVVSRCARMGGRNGAPGKTRACDPQLRKTTKSPTKTRTYALDAAGGGT